jgi:citrate lyase beta subunit
MTSLEEKIAARSGRLQLIVAALAELARVMDSQDANANLDYALDRFMELAGDYGIRWLDETSCLLKEMYNRRSGP